MTTIKKLEKQIHEISYFFATVISFFILISGLLYLTVNQSSLNLMLGDIGSKINSSLFSSLGLAYFYLMILPLQISQVIIKRISSFKDFKENGLHFLTSLIANSVLLVLTASCLSVINAHLSFIPTQSLSMGLGGFIGNMMGLSLYSSIGLFGSLVIFATLMLTTLVLADFIELPKLFSKIKTTSKTLKQVLMSKSIQIQSSIIEALRNTFKSKAILATGSTKRKSTKKSNSWISRKIITDHFHIYPETINNSLKKMNLISSDNKTTKKASQKKRTRKKSTAKKKTATKRKVAKKTSTRTAKKKITAKKKATRSTTRATNKAS